MRWDSCQRFLVLSVVCLMSTGQWGVCRVVKRLFEMGDWIESEGVQKVELTTVDTPAFMT